MKIKNSFCIGACILLAGVFLLLPYGVFAVTDTGLYSAPQARAAVQEQLSSAGRSSRLACALYAEAHLRTNYYTGGVSPQDTPTDASLLLTALAQLQAAAVCTAQQASEIEQYLRENSRDCMQFQAWERPTLLTYSCTESIAMTYEPSTQKMVNVTWPLQADDDAALLQAYLQYLDIDKAEDWQSVTSAAQRINVTAVYSPSLQLYVNVSHDDGVAQPYTTLSVVSMTQAQLEQIIVTA